MATVYLALGSNLGDRAANLDAACTRLSQRGVTIIKRSAVIETVPEGGPPQGLYLNGVVKATTHLLPTQLLNVAHNIEKELGRTRTVPNGPRTIDIDILLYDQVQLDTPALQIPHPRMKQREFVMKPLLEIEPGLKNVL